MSESLDFDETQARWVFASLVWLNDTSEWALFEFDKAIMSNLSSYALRNNGMQKLEILVSRHEDGTIRLNAGFDSLTPVRELVEETTYAVMEDLAARLLDRYRKLGTVQIKI